MCNAFSFWLIFPLMEVQFVPTLWLLWMNTSAMNLTPTSNFIYCSIFLWNGPLALLFSLPKSQILKLDQALGLSAIFRNLLYSNFPPMLSQEKEELILAFTDEDYWGGKRQRKSKKIQWKSCCIHCKEEREHWPRERTLWSRVPTALADGTSLVSSTHITGQLIPSSGLFGHLTHMCIYIRRRDRWAEVVNSFNSRQRQVNPYVFEASCKPRLLIRSQLSGPK